MGKILDLTGLAYLWEKIKTALDEKAGAGHTHSEYLTGSDVSNIYAKKTDIANVYVFKGNKSSESVLPSNGNTVGDVYNVMDTGKNYAWTGTEWDDLGGNISVESITYSEIDEICV